MIYMDFSVCDIWLMFQVLIYVSFIYSTREPDQTSSGPMIRKIARKKGNPNINIEQKVRIPMIVFPYIFYP